MEDLAFIRAIRENPEDNALRLVYADWLDEHDGQRGEFLRLQQTLATLDTGDNRADEVRRRMEELRPGFSAAWLTCVDRVERFTMLWRCFFYDESGNILTRGLPLRSVAGYWNKKWNSVTLKRDWYGCYVYPMLSYRGNVWQFLDVPDNLRLMYPRENQPPLRLLGRMRVLRLTVRQLVMGADLEPEIHRAFCSHILEGSEGTPVRFDLGIPADVLARLRFRQIKGHRAVTHIRNGRLWHGGVEAVDRICCLTAHSAQDFDSLIDGDCQPPPVAIDPP